MLYIDHVQQRVVVGDLARYTILQMLQSVPR